MFQESLGHWLPGVVNNCVNLALFDHFALFKEDYFLHHSKCLRW
jgi:hypothetical protein